MTKSLLLLPHLPKFSEVPLVMTHVLPPCQIMVMEVMIINHQQAMERTLMVAIRLAIIWVSHHNQILGITTLTLALWIEVIIKTVCCESDSSKNNAFFIDAALPNVGNLIGGLIGGNKGKVIGMSKFKKSCKSLLYFTTILYAKKNFCVKLFSYTPKNFTLSIF